MKAEYACFARLIADMVGSEMKGKMQRGRRRETGPFWEELHLGAAASFDQGRSARLRLLCIPS